MDFADLKTVTADQLMYVKEDLIIPQTNTFYDFIVVKARGKSGPLFAFDVHDDIRLVNDASVEKDESHAGKVTPFSEGFSKKTTYYHLVCTLNIALLPWTLRALQRQIRFVSNISCVVFQAKLF